MADMLASPEDLASLLQQDLDAATATLLLECATAVVQEAAGQRIVLVEDDPFETMGLTDSWLSLPQIPVIEVSGIELDGVALVAGRGAEEYRLRGSRLWRTCGWQTYANEPSDVAGLYSHGYASGSQDLQLARNASLSLAKLGYSNPSGVTNESIDDYSVGYNAMAAQLEMTPHLKAALRKKYGRRAGYGRTT